MLPTLREQRGSPGGERGTLGYMRAGSSLTLRWGRLVTMVASTSSGHSGTRRWTEGHFYLVNIYFERYFCKPYHEYNKDPSLLKNIFLESTWENW